MLDRIAHGNVLEIRLARPPVNALNPELLAALATAISATLMALMTVRTAVINKRGGGMGLISGRKAFQKPMNEGVALLHAIQDVYLAPEITIA
jgi:enoyl-CoA hydratase/carnithine racemase